MRPRTEQLREVVKRDAGLRRGLEYFSEEWMPGFRKKCDQLKKLAQLPQG
jgi:hypothetical protein